MAYNRIKYASLIVLLLLSMGLLDATASEYEPFYENSAGDAYIEILSPNGGESYKAGDIIEIKWKQQGVSWVQLFFLQGSLVNHITGPDYVTNDDGTLLEADGEYTYLWDTSDAYNYEDFHIDRDNLKIKVNVMITDPETDVKFLEDISDDTFRIYEEPEEVVPYDFESVTVDLGGVHEYQHGDSLQVTWSSSCQAPFVDVWLVQDLIEDPNEERVVYLTSWSPGGIFSPNTALTKNVGSFTSGIPINKSLGFINDTYVFNWNAVEGSLGHVVYPDSFNLALEPGVYEVRVRVHKQGDDLVIWEDGSFEDLTDAPSCVGTGVSEPILISAGDGYIEPIAGSDVYGDDAIVIVPWTGDSSTNDSVVDIVYDSDNPVVNEVLEREQARLQPVNEALVDSVSGKVLLQVAESGNAWYIPPTAGKRYFLADGNTAFDILRDFGLGITEEDIAKIPVGLEEQFVGSDTDDDGLADRLEEGLGTDPFNADSDGDGFLDGEEIENNFDPQGDGSLVYDQALLDRLEGYVVLQVFNKGQAWYIHEGKRYYMQDGDAAFDIMRFLSLGISNDDIAQIELGETN